MRETLWKRVFCRVGTFVAPPRSIGGTLVRCTDPWEDTLNVEQGMPGAHLCLHIWAHWPSQNNGHCFALPSTSQAKCLLAFSNLESQSGTKSGKHNSHSKQIRIIQDTNRALSLKKGLDYPVTLVMVLLKCQHFLDFSSLNLMRRIS